MRGSGICVHGPGLWYTADEVFKVVLGSNFLAKYNHTITRAQGRGKGGSPQARCSEVRHFGK